MDSSQKYAMDNSQKYVMGSQKYVMDGQKSVGTATFQQENRVVDST